jgi:DNA repair photolyase
MEIRRTGVTGRGAGIRPANRFERSHRVPLEMTGENEIPRNSKTEFIADHSRSVVSENQSPDVNFRYSLNPYRGCEHGCSYCYARPTHEYLGYDAGLDFETRITVKHDAAKLFREFLARRTWKPETIALSGVTDPYQPCEREFRITRACLEVAAAARQPISIITKNALVTRDLDILGPMAAGRLIRVNISITTLDPALSRVMEPRASAPAARLRAVRELTKAGVPVRVLVAPIVPAITDHEVPMILRAAKDAGAISARYIVLRLPLTVEPVFLDWLERVFPEKREKVISRIRAIRGGKLYESGFDRRMTGTGEVAEQIGNVFRVFAGRNGLLDEMPPLDCSRFVPPSDARGQGRLF